MNTNLVEICVKCLGNDRFFLFLLSHLLPYTMNFSIKLICFCYGHALSNDIKFIWGHRLCFPGIYQRREYFRWKTRRNCLNLYRDVALKSCRNSTFSSIFLRLYWLWSILAKTQNRVPIANKISLERKFSYQYYIIFSEKIMV